jgi:hypothetical protein
MSCVDMAAGVCAKDAIADAEKTKITTAIRRRASIMRPPIRSMFYSLREVLVLKLTSQKMVWGFGISGVGVMYLMRMTSLPISL